MKVQTKHIHLVLLVVLTLLFVQSLAIGQVATGALTGTVYDSSGAVVANAKVELKNELNNITRETVANGLGYFSFVAVPPGSYTVTITAQGFAKWQMTKIVFNQAENRTLANIALKPGGAAENVTVEATVDAVPLDTSESRMTLNNYMVTQMAIQGRDAAELLKIMPGMGMNAGLSQSQFTSLTTETNTGPIGKYTASGNQPYGPIAITSDGANIVDTGNQGTHTQNLNQDQIQEVTILNSSYGAEFAKGPVTFQAISKSGGSQFHGSGYLYARNSALNANDSYFNAQKIDKPEDSQYYPGFTFGGPVLLPGTSFNRNRDKLFFFTGYEYMKQSPFPTLHQLFVPPARMLAGDFSQAYMQSLGLGNFWSMNVPCGNTGVWNYGNFCGTPAGSVIQNGIIPSSLIDSNALALAKLFPAPNQDGAQHNGYNYRYLDASPMNRWEFKLKMDYNLSEKTQLSGSFTKQNELQINNFGVWWWPDDTLPYPSPLNAHVISNVWSTRLTHTFSPTLTNYFNFGLAYFTFPPRLANPSAVDPAKVGFTATGPFSPNIAPQIPNMVSWACNNGSSQGCFPGWYAPGFPSGFQGGAFGNQKYAPNFSDDMAKVVGTHTLKFGFYWDMNRQYYTTGYGDWGQGMYNFDPWGNNSTNNPIADFLIGHAAGYQQTSKLSIIDLRYKQIAFYAQDAWKVYRKLTITYGIRFDHEGQWYPANSPGLAIWDPNLYSNASNAPQFTGMTWNKIDKNIPISGLKSKIFYPSPRVGVAYDIFGTGKTVLRGGFGWYRWQLSDNDTGIAYNTPLGIQSVSTGALNSFADAANYAPGGVITGFNGNAMALAKGDDKTPYTQNWNFIVSQAMWGKSTLEVQYQGNRTRDALFAGNGGNMNFFANINKIPMGALFGPDPVDPAHTNYWATSCAAGDCQMPNDTNRAHYRPYANYGDALDVVTHGAYSNYHALMVNWQKTRGPINFQANYTFSKVLGLRDGQTNNGGGTGPTLDPFNIRANYGPLAYDHTHIFNVAYVISLPNRVHSNALLATVANGWQLSGIIQAQSGAPIQPNTQGTLNAQFNGVGNTQILGTNAAPLVPVLTCNPGSDLHPGQYFNPNCFTGPPVTGSNGTIIWPYIKGPGYSNADLSIYKNFKVSEGKSVQFRWNMFNFLNHPLPEFGRGNDINLNFTATRHNNATNPTMPTYTYVRTNTCNAGQPRAGQACTDGRPAFTVGHRIMELAIKFEF